MKDLSANIVTAFRLKTNTAGTVLIVSLLGGGSVAGIELLKLSNEQEQLHVEQVKEAVEVGADTADKAQDDAPSPTAAGPPAAGLPLHKTRPTEVPQHGSAVE